MSAIIIAALILTDPMLNIACLLSIIVSLYFLITSDSGEEYNFALIALITSVTGFILSANFESLLMGIGNA